MDHPEVRYKEGSQISFFHPKSLRFFIPLFLTLFTLIAFWQVKDNEFINLDDDLYVTDNPNVHKGLTLEGVPWASTTTQGGNWHPVT